MVIKNKTIEPATEQTPQFDKWQQITLLLMIVSISGFVGWLWEFMLMEVKGGFGGLYVNGGNFLPWMNIYAYGAILVLLTCYRLREKPWAVFLMGAISTGLLEWLSGWIVYTIYDGARYWDYSTSWIGVGHINGFVCPVSACVFGLAALFLIYILLPSCVFLVKHFPKRTLFVLAASVFALIMVDDIINLTLKNLNKPTAQDFYIEHGWTVFEE